MIRFFLVLAVLGAVVAYAAGGRGVAVVQGTGVRCYTSGRTGEALLLQCPNIDGGSGQKVWYQTGRGDGGGAVDAGFGDLMIDFTVNNDPVPVSLGSAENRICLASFLSYGTALYCTVAVQK